PGLRVPQFNLGIELLSTVSPRQLDIASATIDSYSKDPGRIEHDNIAVLSFPADPQGTGRAIQANNRSARRPSHEYTTCQLVITYPKPDLGVVFGRNSRIVGRPRRRAAAKRGRS